LTEDAIKDKTQGKSTQAVVEDNHGPWVQGYFIFFTQIQKMHLLQSYEPWVDGGSVKSRLGLRISASVPF